MKHKPVTSSNISAIGYDPKTKLLEVVFHSGRTYQYEGVPASVVDDLENASSIGKYFNENIKGVYHYSEV